MDNPVSRLRTTAPEILAALRRVPSRAADTAEVVRMFGQGVGADVLGGLSGAGTLMLTGDPDKAADNTTAVREKYAYQPKRKGTKEILGAVGEGIGQFSRVKDTPIGRKAIEGWEGATNASPFLGATLAGVAGVAAPGGEELQVAKQVARAVPKSVRELGTGKLAREAAASARLESQLAEAEALRAAGGEVARAEGAGTREARDATYWRDKYAAEGSAKVLRSAKRGEHLKPQKSGGYAGAPRTVRGAGELTNLRRDLDRQLGAGAEALQYADPERVGTWYDRAKAAQAETNEPYQLPRSLEGHATYSAGVSPESELGFTLRHQNSRALGEPEKAYRSAPANALDRAVTADQPAPLAAKIGEYGSKNDPRVVEDSPFGVNDFRMAQTYGYTTPQGEPWTAGATAPMHNFMDAETVLAVDRANRKKTGGVENWTGAKLQEVPWVYGKASDLYNRGKNSRYAEQEGQAAALREANKTIADYMPKHALSVTAEPVPGRGTGHRQDVLRMPFEEKRAYGKQGSWTRPGDALETPGGEVGAGDRDVLYSALGMRQQPALESIGNYDSVQEPMTISRPLVDFENVLAAKAEGRTVAPSTINPRTQRAVEAAEVMRGGVDAQRHVAANLPVTGESRKGRTHATLDLPGGAPRTPEEMQAIITKLREAGAPEDLLSNMTATNRGVQFLTGFTSSPRANVKLLEDNASALGGTVSRSANEGLYLPAMRPERHAGKGVTTARILRRWAKAPEQAALNVSESEGVRKALREKIARDAGHAGTAEDLQKMRKFFADEDWAPVAALIRKGMKPAAAMAALGFSMKGMAAETEPNN